MDQRHLKNQKTIKVLPEGEYTRTGSKRIESDRACALPEGYVVLQMEALEKPEPIKQRRKAKSRGRRIG